MKIIRYQDKAREYWLRLTASRWLGLETPAIIFTTRFQTHNRESGSVAQLLAPVATDEHSFASDLNYRKHAEETGAKFPEFPVVFFKGINALQNPGEPIQIPTHLRSDEVDYECELAVVIGSPAKM